MNHKSSATRTLPLFILAAIATATIVTQTEAQFLPPMQISNNVQNESINRNFFEISRDGQQVVFLSSQGFTQELFSVSTNQGSVVRLNPDLVLQSSAQSPD